MPSMGLIVQVFFFVNALVWLVFGVLSLSLAVEVGTITRNVVLSITDQFGLIDAFILLLDLCLLGLLFITRQQLNQAES